MLLHRRKTDRPTMREPRAKSSPTNEENKASKGLFYFL